MTDHQQQLDLTLTCRGQRSVFNTTLMVTSDFPVYLWTGQDVRLRVQTHTHTQTHTPEAVAHQECPDLFSSQCFTFYIICTCRRKVSHTQAHTCPFPVSLCGRDLHLHPSRPFTFSKHSALILTWAVKYYDLRITPACTHTHTHTHTQMIKF